MGKSCHTASRILGLDGLGNGHQRRNGPCFHSKRSTIQTVAESWPIGTKDLCTLSQQAEVEADAPCRILRAEKMPADASDEGRLEAPREVPVAKKVLKTRGDGAASHTLGVKL